MEPSHSSTLGDAGILPLGVGLHLCLLVGAGGRYGGADDTDDGGADRDGGQDFRAHLGGLHRAKGLHGPPDRGGELRHHGVAVGGDGG